MKRLLSVAGFGVVSGPLIALVLRSLPILADTPTSVGDVGTVAGLARAAWTGVAYAVPFYVCCALPASVVRRRLQAMSPWVCMLGTTVTGLGGGVPAYLTAGALLGRWPWQLPVSRMTLVDGLVVMAIVTAVSLWRRRAAEQLLVTVRAQSHALQAQINPHFFFNTLNTIAALIPDAPLAAQHTIGQLAEMSRYAFASAERPQVPLAEELQFARAYLEIERARFGERLQFELPTDADVEGLELPPLTVQPLVENAVRHGIARRPDGGTVSVRVSRHGTGFSVIIENDTEEGVTAAEAAFFRPSHALTNIRDRLRLLYHGMAWIDVSVPRPQRVSVTIRALTLPT